VPQKYEVIVVGGGPVGATALALLGHAGIPAVGIERETETWPFARAVHFDGETLRLLQALGLADEVFTQSRPMCDMRIVNEAGETLLAAELGQLGPQAWHDDVVFHQPVFEPILRAEVGRLPGVELRTGTTMLDFTQDADGVHCRVENPGGGTETVSARWIIACDGASSAVRHQLGIQAESLGSDDPWLIADGILRDSPGIPGDMVMLGHYSRPALWLRLPGDRVRMEFKVMPGDDRDEIVTPEGVERVSRGALPAARFSADRVAIYTFRSRLARQWRAGNVFLAGDAAHQAPPLFGQGLCAGMRDVANLTWKLRLVSRGLAEDSLLETYESERRPHARYWVEAASTMAALMQTTDPEVAAGRDEHIRASPTSSIPPAPPLGPGLHDGAADERAGLLSVQPRLPDGRRLDDLVGTRFLLAARRELLDALPADLVARVTASEEIIAISDPNVVGELLASARAGAVCVRPDRYILGAADDVAALGKLLRQVPSVVPVSASPARARVTPV
jgi:3-(3-hydroxy-phenyl)propionate hydroxylase